MAGLELNPLAAWSSLGFSTTGFFVLLFVGLALSSYVKIATVLSILRAGLGFQSLPGIVVTGGLALSLTFFTMYPTLVSSMKSVEQVRGESHDADRALQAVSQEWKSFAVRLSHAEEKTRFSELASRLNGEAASPELEQSWQVLAPAFIVSQLKEAFRTGLTIILPLLVIDLLVAQIFVALGLVNVSPTLVAFPLKLVLFLVAGGWSLITANLVASYIPG